MRRLAILTAGLLLLVVAGCATITRGTTDVLEINSTPQGADVKTSLGHACTTPCVLTLDRDAELTVDITKDGCEPANIQVTNKVADTGAAGMAGNVIFGGLIGLGVDAATGATQELVPNPVLATLDCGETASGEVRQQSN